MATLQKNQPYILMGTGLVPLLTSEETAGEVVVMKLTIVKGLEPPMHYFENTDELWKVIEGELTFHFEDKTQEVKAGDTIFISKNTLNTFSVNTGTATVIVSMTSPDYETVAAEFSRPASDENDLPDSLPPMDQIQQLIAFGAKHGLIIQIPK